MRLINTEYDIELNLSLEQTNVLCIEKQEVFTDCVMNLWNQYESGLGNWILSEGEDILNMAKSMSCIINPICLDCNDKKLLKVLYQDMEADVQGIMSAAFGMINSQIVSFLDDVVKRQPYAIEFDDNVSFLDLLKIYNVHFYDETSNLLEKIIVYIQLWHRVCHINVFVFVNLKAYLGDDDIEKLYEMIRYEQVYFILIESVFSKKLVDEKVKIIDNDLCVIDC